MFYVSKCFNVGVSQSFSFLKYLNVKIFQIESVKSALLQSF